MSILKWADQIGYTDEAPAQSVRLLLYGEPGVGKTHLAGTFPKPFFLDADRGLRTLKGFHLPFVPLTLGGRTYREVMEILDAIGNKKPPFDEIDVETVVFDSLTELATMLLHESLRYPTMVHGKASAPRDPTQDKPEFDDYSRISGRMDSIMLTCRDIGLHVVATAGVKIEKDDMTGGIMAGPNLVGGYRQVIGHKFDEFFYLESKEVSGKITYYAHTTRYRYYAAKSRDGRTGRIENPNYTELYGSSTGDTK